MHFVLLANAVEQSTIYSCSRQGGEQFSPKAVEPNFFLADFLVRDGWAVYRRFVHALHQSCLAHRLRRCRKMTLLARKQEASFRVRYKP